MARNDDGKRVCAKRRADRARLIATSERNGDLAIGCRLAEWRLRQHVIYAAGEGIDPAAIKSGMSESLRFAFA
ncbi:MAG: hypothetical protein R3C51_01515 [Parvularculaceae bacterium]